MAKMLRDIIRINEELCDGCGECVSSCAEGALEIVDGKARLKGEILCDGAGACVGHCPTGALTVEKRESEAYDETAVAIALRQSQRHDSFPLAQARPGSIHATAPGSCPGSAVRQWGDRVPFITPEAGVPGPSPARPAQTSELRQWPVQLMLVPPTAPYFKNADLLIVADCVPFAIPDFHQRFLKGKALVVGCPKLDNLQHYFEKLTEIFKSSDLKSVEVVKMEVPCCGGIAQAAIEARNRAGVGFPLTVTTLGIRGDLLESYDA